MNIFEALLGLFLPRICHICNEKLTDDEQFVCSECLSRLPRTGYEKYWANTSKVNSDLNPLEQRFAGQLPLERGCAPYFYTRDSSLATLIQDFKYRGFSRLATTMGRIGAEELKESGLFDGVDVLVPVPIHRTKRFKRGYNQSEELAKGISEATGIPVGHQVTAKRPHRTQTSLTAQQRLENTKDIFRVSNPESLNDKTVMLVDDICTTGATLLSLGEEIVKCTQGVKLRIFTLGVV